MEHILFQDAGSPLTQFIQFQFELWLDWFLALCLGEWASFINAATRVKWKKSSNYWKICSADAHGQVELQSLMHFIHWKRQTSIPTNTTEEHAKSCRPQNSYPGAHFTPDVTYEATSLQGTPLTHKYYSICSKYILQNLFLSLHSFLWCFCTIQCYFYLLKTSNSG